MDNIRTFSKFLLSLAIRVVIAILVGTLLLTAVYMLPTDRMENHLAASAEVFAREGAMPELFPWCTSYLDNFTDAIILSNAAHDVPASPMVQAMTAARYEVDGYGPAGSLVAHYVQGQAFDTEVPYYQYWHGYLVLVKPLLFLTTYQGIRLINAIAQLALLILLISLMVKKGLKAYILPYLLCVAFFMPVILALSLQFSSCYYILTIGSILILLSKDHLDAREAYVFLYLGTATAFLDFLTYPITTLGIPAVLYFSIRKHTDIKETFFRGVKICFSWGFGYGVMWAGKWVAGSIITGKNVLAEASAKIAERSSANIATDENLLKNIYTALSANVKFFIRTPVTALFVIFMLVLLVLLVIAWKKKQFILKDAGQILFPFLILAFLPMVWYAVTTNHSIIHYWFTGKSLCVTVLAAMCSLTKIYKDLTVKQKNVR